MQTYWELMWVCRCELYVQAMMIIRYFGCWVMLGRDVCFVVKLPCSGKDGYVCCFVFRVMTLVYAGYHDLVTIPCLPDD